MKTMKECNDYICPIARASALVADMWTILIVRELLKGSKRFTELREDIVPCDSKTPINTRTLTKRLKDLEKAGIIARTEYEHEMPPKVEYSLTKKGQALSKVLDQLRNYGKKYL
jgi:DNA-binding HxlR family transcriptional regulator